MDEHQGDEAGAASAAELLARFEITAEQATRFWLPENREVADIEHRRRSPCEPYLLYELDRRSSDPISLLTVDRGVFPPLPFATHTHFRLPQRSTTRLTRGGCGLVQRARARSRRWTHAQAACLRGAEDPRGAARSSVPRRPGHVRRCRGGVCAHGRQGRDGGRSSAYQLQRLNETARIIRSAVTDASRASATISTSTGARSSMRG